MGGGQALSIWLNHLETFSDVGAFSAAAGQAANFPTAYASLVVEPERTNRQLSLLWVGCGTDDSLFPASKSFSEFLGANTIKDTFRETGAVTRGSCGGGT